MFAKPETNRSICANWILAADASLATTRLHGLLIVDALRPLGVRARVLSRPPFAVMDAPWPPELQRDVTRLLAGEIVVFQKLRGRNAAALADSLRAGGAATVFVHGDHDPANGVVLRCDAFVGSSQRLVDFWLERGARRVAYIPDPAEWWCERDDIRGDAREPGVVRVAWMGNRASWTTLEPIRKLLSEPEFADFRLTTVANHPEADVAWSEEAVRRVVGACDLGVVPVRPPPVSTVKSSNRVVQFMAAGKPVAAGRIPSYEEVVRQGESGFLCDEPEDWRAAFRALRDSDRRGEIARAAWDTVYPEYHIDSIARRWLEMLCSLEVPERPPLGRFMRVRLAAAVQAQADLALSVEGARRGFSRRWIILRVGRGLARLPLSPLAVGRGAAQALRLVPRARR